MFERMAKSLAGPMLLAGALLVAPAARADDHCRKPSVDIDSLHSEIVPDGNDWLLRVRCKVKIEHAVPQELFTLGMQIKENGYCLTDTNGHVFTATLPLERPVKVDKDKVTYQVSTDIRPPAGMVRLPDHLRLQSFVTFDGDSHWLDDESTSVKFCHNEAPVAPAPIEAYAPPVQVVQPAPVVEVVRPAPIVFVRPAPVVTVVRPAPLVVARPYYAPGVVVARPVYAAPYAVGPAHGVGVNVRTNNVHVAVGAGW